MILNSYIQFFFGNSIHKKYMLYSTSLFFIKNQANYSGRNTHFLRTTRVFQIIETPKHTTLLVKRIFTIRFTTCYIIFEISILLYSKGLPCAYIHSSETAFISNPNGPSDSYFSNILFLYNIAIGV